LIYCDSSFLVALYLQTQSLSTVAREMVDSFEEAIAFPWLTELEVLTVLRRTLGPAALRKALSAIGAARTDGILVRCVVEKEAYSRRALELSKRHAAEIQCRTLDILHVALALETETPYFVSFDRRQRQLAQAVRLKVLPKDLGSQPLHRLT
jgi:predicted nucleic acid-binding protein